MNQPTSEIVPRRDLILPQLCGASRFLRRSSWVSSSASYDNILSGIALGPPIWGRRNPASIVETSYVGEMCGTNDDQQSSSLAST
jgi:hypothetical protein